MNPKDLHIILLDKIETQLNKIFDEINSPADQLLSAMKYVSLSGGKRIRPLFVLAGGMFVHTQDIDETNLEKLLYIGCAIELIHCYSLVHDDLPAMDNDDLRRGKPTCHRQFNEATAILVGDALQSLAFEILSSDNIHLPDDIKIKLIRLFATAIGLNGMVGGQAVDLYNTGRDIDITQLQQMHSLKTGCLIKTSIIMGVTINNNTNNQLIDKLSIIGDKIGLLYQIIDDIIDVTSDTKTLGKTTNKDNMQHKSTYVSLLGLNQAHEYANKIYDEIMQYLTQIPHSDFLIYLTQLVYQRTS